MGERFSFTKLSLADKCLSQFHARYETPLGERLPSLYNRLRDSGSAVHACIDKYKQHLQSTLLEQDLEMVPLIVEDVFSTAKENYSTEIYDDVFWTFRKFAVAYRHSPAKYIGGEFLLERALPESDDTLEAYPDHIETQEDEHGPIVVSEDYKTGYKSEVTEDNRFQGEIVAWLMLDYFPGQRVGYRVSFPRQETREPIVELDPRWVSRLEGRIRSIIAKIRRARETNRWPATPGGGCKWCPLAAKCAERNVAVANDMLVDSDELARKAAADYILLEAALEQRGAQVKSWAKDAGPVSVNDREVIGYVTKTGNPKIGDAGMMVLALGTREAIAQMYAKDADDPVLKTEEGMRLVISLGLQLAIRLKLLSVNGNQTKSKAIQNDERLSGLWVPGDSRTAFEVFSKGVPA